MVSEIQIHTIARQMIEKHGFDAIAQAARNAEACEHKGDTEEAREWRHGGKPAASTGLVMGRILSRLAWRLWLARQRLFGRGLPSSPH
jgi:hypothetical protein